MYSLTQCCPLSHTVVGVAQQTLAELVEGDLEQQLSKPLLSWWKESVPGEKGSQTQQIFAELVKREVGAALPSCADCGVERALQLHIRCSEPDSEPSFC